MGGRIATLLVTCPDQKGLVAALAQQLYDLGANILDADQHSDPEAGQFFQRIRFESEGIERPLLQERLGEVAPRYGMQWRLAYDEDAKRVAIFVSKYEHCLWDLLLRHRAGELKCEVSVVVSNHPDLETVAEHFGLPFRVFSITKENKAAQETAQRELLAHHQVDLVVMARYMQILTSEFVAQYPSRIINIHHSFLPAFMGGRPYHQAHGRGVKLIGATAHYATANLDEGSIIEQDVTRTTHRDSVADLIRKGRDLERTVLSRAVRCHLEDRVLVYQNKTVVFD